MPELILVGEKNNELVELQSALTHNGFTCDIIPCDDDAAEQIFIESPEIVLVQVNGYRPGGPTREYVQQIKLRNSVPLIALVNQRIIDDVDVDQNLDDFIINPFHTGELLLRIKRILKREVVPDDRETISSNGLVIDLARCEVSVEGKKVELTFKEYELLKFLARNSGRVYSREALLDKIWGMDYFGGDRTVDVHIRRLRSKIEKPDKAFIETVRNIGYRFKEDDSG
ncbi:MAG: response regulator transcription factor [Dehalococcoidales bacterium]|nr:response regulator transcription factor [Dehalococcoidales bacterium]